MPSADLATHKLIVLSILSQLPGITLSQLTTIALETLYMDYFEFVLAYEELSRDQLVTESVRKGESKQDAFGRPISRCDLTPAGQTVFEQLKDRMPHPIRSYLAQACLGWKKDIRQKNVLTARCDPDGNGLYLVALTQNDGIKDLIDLKITVSDRQVGQVICERWQRQPLTLYLGLLSLLTGDPIPVSDRISAAETEQDPDQDQTADHEPLPRQQTLFTGADTGAGPSPD